MKLTREEIQAQLDQFREGTTPERRTFNCPFNLNTKWGTQRLCSVCSEILDLFPSQVDECLNHYSGYKAFAKPNRIGADPYDQKAYCPCNLFGIEHVRAKIQAWERRIL